MSNLAARLFPSSVLLAISVALASVIVSGVVTACAPAEPVSSEDPLTEDAASVIPAAEDENDGGTRQDDVDAGRSDGSRTCGVSFATNVMPALEQLGCSSITCHGTRFGKAPRLESKDVELTYRSLVAQKLGTKPYVKASSFDPNESAIHCHLRRECGAVMPPSGAAIPKTLIESVDAWLACGAPQN